MSFEVSFGNRSIPIAEFNVAHAEVGDEIIIPSTQQIDLAAKFMGAQMLVLCGAEPVFDPDDPRVFSGRTFVPYSKTLQMGDVQPHMLNPRLYVTAPPTGPPELIVDANLPRAFTAKFVFAVDVCGDDDKPVGVHSQHAAFIGSASTTKLSRQRPCRSAPGVDFTERLHKALKSPHYPRNDRLGPNDAQRMAVDRLIADAQPYFQ